MRSLAALILAFALSGCAAIPAIEDAATSTTTFAACKSLDVLTTKLALNSGKFVEGNKLLAPFIGPHNFTPLIVFSIGAYLLLRYVDDKRVTAFANVVTCGVAARNTVLINNSGLLH